MKKKTKTTVVSDELKKYLKPFMPKMRSWNQYTETDLAEFKKDCTSRPDNAYKRRNRQDIKKSFGKPVEELTLAEFQDFQKPNFHAADYLGELWPQLTPAEQDLIKQVNEWAFIFPASFADEREAMQARAGRLQKFFNRKFKVK